MIKANMILFNGTTHSRLLLLTVEFARILFSTGWVIEWLSDPDSWMSSDSKCAYVIVIEANCSGASAKSELFLWIFHNLKLLHNSLCSVCRHRYSSAWIMCCVGTRYQRPVNAHMHTFPSAFSSSSSSTSLLVLLNYSHTHTRARTPCFHFILLTRAYAHHTPLTSTECVTF